MAYITRIVFRHADSIRSQVVGSLGMIFKACRKFDLTEWLAASAPILRDHVTDNPEEPRLCLSHGDANSPLGQNYALLLNAAIFSLDYSRRSESEWGRAYFDDETRSSSGGEHHEEDYYGTDLGGDWDIPNFIVRSGIVLLLGALEEFERGTLRILTKTVPNPCSQSASRDVVFPRLADYQHQSQAYAQLVRNRRLISVKGRHQELARYGIILDAQAEWNQTIQTMRKSRNTIAHGVAALAHPFQDYLRLHYAVYRSAAEIADQVKSKHYIAL
jgi:hypothetical protein